MNTNFVQMNSDNTLTRVQFVRLLVLNLLSSAITYCDSTCFWFVSVSYTHLDVYKRQVVDRLQLINQYKV